jgi:Ca2+-binding RTX toxin-like protein
MLERLENRILLSVKHDVANRLLVVTGTNGDDRVLIEQAAGPRVVVIVNNEPAESFRLAEVKKVRVRALGGDDSVEVAEIERRTTLDGGAGDDTLIGAVGRDQFRGGPGFDTVDYSARALAVNLSADNLPNDGGIGERDNIRNDVEHVIGGMGADTIVAGALAMRINGWRGADTITGSAGDDTILASWGNDSVLAGAGNDIVAGEWGADTLSGGDGDDNMYGDNALYDGKPPPGPNDLPGGPDSISGDGGDDSIAGGPGADQLDGGEGSDVFINLDEESDFMNGGPGLDLRQAESEDGSQGIEGQFDFTNPNGGPGAVLAELEAGAVLEADGTLTVTGDDATSDVIVISRAGAQLTVNLNGETRNFAYGNVERIAVALGAGNDSVRLHNPDGSGVVGRPSSISGGSGSDTLLGGGGADTIFAGDGDDEVRGFAGDDILYGEADDDWIDAGLGADLLGGGRGTGAPSAVADGRDVLRGGGGSDYVDYSRRSDPLRLSLDDTPNDGAIGEKDLIHESVEKILAGAGADRIEANGLANFVAGGGGDDEIRGFGGVNYLVGGVGNDTVRGGADIDSILLEDSIRDRFDPGSGDNFVTIDRDLDQRL